MDRGDVPRDWIGQRVRAKIKTRRGGKYLVLAELADTNGEGIEPFGGTSPGTKAANPEVTRAYPWTSLVDVQPPKVG